MTAPMLLALRGVHAGPGRRTLLTGVWLDVAEAEAVLVTDGPGDAATALLDVVAGALRPRDGEVRFRDQDVTRWPVDRRVRAGLGHLPATDPPFADLTVVENLRVGGYPLPPAAVGPEVERVLGSLPALRRLAGRRPGTLSDGERRLLAVGRALVARPALLAADDPTRGLSATAADAVVAALAEAQAAGTALLVAAERDSPCADLASATYALADGALVREEVVGGVAR